MREPSIHITRRSLRFLLHEWFKNHGISKPAELLVDHLMTRGVNYALTQRIQLVDTNEKQQKRVNRVVMNKTENALFFSGMLYKVRTQLKHRGITRYQKAHRDWEFIVELSGLANEFCEAFGLSVEEGYREYIRMFFQGKRGVFKLRQMKSMHENLMQKYDSKLKVEQDPNPEHTELAYATYGHLVYQATGIVPNYKDVPEKYLYFVEVSRLCQEMGVKPEDFITGNFETLASFSTGIPSPEQLITPNGIERVVRWLAENRIVSKKSEVREDLVEDFKKRISKHKQDEDYSI